MVNVWIEQERYRRDAYLHELEKQKRAGNTDHRLAHRNAELIADEAVKDLRDRASGKTRREIDLERCWEALSLSVCGRKKIRLYTDGKTEAEEFPDAAAFTAAMAARGMQAVVRSGGYLHPEVRGLPVIDMLDGPMWDGGAIRYEQLSAE